MSIYSELEAFYVEREEIKARRDKLLAERGYDEKTLSEYSYDDDEFDSVDYELYTIERAINELEWRIYIMNGGCGCE